MLLRTIRETQRMPTKIETALLIAAAIVFLVVDTMYGF